MPETHPFVTYLEGLAEREDRGALAALRRGLGQPPGTVAATYPYVVPWLPRAISRQGEAAYYCVGALYALHPAPGGEGNLGQAFRKAQGRESPGESRESGKIGPIERRFTALLAAHPDDLADHLRQAVSLLKSKEVPIDWHQLIRDIQSWNHPSHYVQREWARAFWGRPETEQTEASEEKEN